MKKLVTLGIVSILIIGIAGCTTPQSTENDTPQNEEVSTNQEVTNYHNITLDMTFDYPAEWEAVYQELDGTDHLALSVFENSTIFLAADSGGESVARGAYWGDSAGLITNQDYIDSLCDTKTDAQSCEIKTNSNGIRYAKVVEEVTKFGEPTIETNYYLYHPKSDYKGIIVSTERLRAKNIENLEQKLDKLVDSINFLD